MAPRGAAARLSAPAGHRARLSRCRATACCSNMTAARSRAGSARPMAPRSRRRRGGRPGLLPARPSRCRRRPHRCRRPRAGPGRPSRPRPRLAPERLAGALNFHLRPHPITVLEAREAAAPTSTPAFPAPAAATSTASSTAAAPRRWSAAASGTSRCRSTPSGCTSPPRPWSAATTSPASAPANASRPRR